MVLSFFDARPDVVKLHVALLSGDELPELTVPKVATVNDVKEARELDSWMDEWERGHAAEFPQVMSRTVS